MFGIERRKSFRFQLDLPASLELVGHESSGRIGARVSDLSRGGVLLHMTGLPPWSLKDTAGHRARFIIDLDLGERSGGGCRFEAKPLRVTAIEGSCRLALQFVSASERSTAALEAFLHDHLSKLADEEVRSSFYRHRQRRRRHTAIALGLTATAALLLTWTAIRTAEAIPDMLSSLRQSMRDEVGREARRQFLEREWVRMRGEGMDPEDFLRDLPPEERARLRRYLEECGDILPRK